MKKMIFFFLILIGIIIETHAQSKYQISGKINGQTEGILFLIRNDGMKTDTLAETELKNGIFVFSGQIDGPAGACITTADQHLTIPLIIEPVNIMINVTASGILIQGGKQQELFTRYNFIGQTLAAEQARIKTAAQQPGANVSVLQKQINQAYSEAQERINRLIQTNANEYATAYLIALNILNETEESLRHKYDLLGDSIKNSIPGQRIAVALEQYSKLTIGKEAPDFSVAMPNGDSFSLHAIPARMKLLVFWISTSPECRRLNPELIQLYQHYRPKGLEMISISFDSDLLVWRKAIETDGLIWRNGSDLKGWESDIAKLYMVNTLPYFVLINNENKIIAKGIWGNELKETIVGFVNKKNKILFYVSYCFQSLAIVRLFCRNGSILTL